MSHQALVELWFWLITFFWCGYLFLEGFDFGVGILLPVLGRNATSRGAMIGSIGPHWDGNEVWVIVAVGATFAAFPGWYATLLGATYPVMFVVLVALILRVAAFEFRSQGSPRWTRWWDGALVLGSAVPPLAWGLLLTVQVSGLPIDARGTFTGRPWDVLGLLPVLGALAFFAVCVAHGATYLSLRTTDPLRGQARRIATLAWFPAAILVAGLFAGLLAASPAVRSHGVPAYLLPALTVLALVVSLLLHLARRETPAFLATGAAVIGFVVTLFAALHPDAIVSTLGAADRLTALASASQPYSLGVLTISAAIFAPIVILYQAWTYWVFRRRLSSRPVPARRPVAEQT